VSFTASSAALAPLSIPSPPTEWQIPISFPIWGGMQINIHMYAICIVVGIVVATLLTEYRLRKRGVEPWAVIDILIWVVPLGIIGARVWHVATHPADFFPVDGQVRGGVAYDWLHVVAIWDGGGAIMGSVLFGALGAFIGARIAGLRFLTVVDAIAPGLLLAQALGRFGNYFNHEIYGMPTDLPWGLEIESTNAAFPVGLADGTLFQPTFLYEIIWNVVGAALLLLIDRKWHPQWGRIFALYLVWYGAGRAWLEPMRLDPSEIYFGLRVNEWGAILVILVGVVLFWVQSVRHTGAEPSPYRPGRGWRPASTEVDSDEFYSESDDEPVLAAAKPE